MLRAACAAIRLGGETFNEQTRGGKDVTCNICTERPAPTDPEACRVQLMLWPNALSTFFVHLSVHYPHQPAHESLLDSCAIHPSRLPPFKERMPDTNVCENYLPRKKECRGNACSIIIARV